MMKTKLDHLVFYSKSNSGIILLVVYVDYIVIIGSDSMGISTLKSFLHTQLIPHQRSRSIKIFLGG